MEYRVSKKLNRKISVLGFGGWQLGNKEFWDGVGYDDGVALVKSAIKEGVTFFDTAPGYSSGMSESIIGEAIIGHRDSVFINTKFGHTAEGHSNFDESVIESEIHNSLKRLKTTYLDSVILHNPPHYILEGKSKHFIELDRLKKKGLIRGYGVSIDSLHELELVLDNLDVDVIEIMFNIIHQEVTNRFEEIKKRGILLVIKVPLDSGWLTGKYNKDSSFSGIRARWNQDSKNIRSSIVDKIKEITKQDNVVQTALSFITSFDAVTTVIPGVKSESQLMKNIEAANTVMDNTIKDQLVALYNKEIKYQNTPW